MSKAREQLIREAYAILGDTTPLATDCGALCGARCCQGEDGMLLLPGESRLLSFVPEFHLFPVPFRGSTAWWMTCDDTCERHLRPFQCRMFPLGPAVVGADKRITAVLDPVAADIPCPLADGKRLQPVFWERVNAAFHHLSQDAKIHRFLLRLADELAAPE